MCVEEKLFEKKNAKKIKKMQNIRCKKCKKMPGKKMQKD